MNLIEFASWLIDELSPILARALTFIESMTEYLAWPVTVIVLALLLRNRLSETIGRLAGAEGPGFKVWFSREASVVNEEIEDQALERATGSVDGYIESTQEPAEEDTAPPEAAEPREAEGRATPVDAEGAETAESRDLPRMTPSNLIDFTRKTIARRDEVRAIAHGVAGMGAYKPRLAVLESFTLLEVSLRELNLLTQGGSGHAQGIHSVLSNLRDSKLISSDSASSIRELSKLRNRVAHTDDQVDVEAASNYANSVSNMLWILQDEVSRKYLPRS